ncbi:MAG: DHH family phosphoesterase, partial [Clostridia bacterium]|nr:DHH family phosphoesterase [Clostridia bacterium]
MINNKTLIFGHKNPDTDSILSSIVMANLENELGNEAVPVRLGKINKETEYVFNYLQIEKPEEISDIEDGQNVILVDHNEYTQSANNIANANILKVVDHHTMNFVAPYQLYYRAEPVGCTATVLYKMYKEYDVEINKTIATLMVSSIISDTLLFKSPTCTNEDKIVAEKLANIAEIDLEVYGKELLKAG